MYSDVVVVGEGLSGLMAAITVAKSGAKVNVLSQGAGVISIGSGVIDFLGYVNGKKIEDNPFNHLSELDSNHPYNLIGDKNIKNAFSDIMTISKSYGYSIKINENGYNSNVISIIGTIKPTYIYGESNDISRIFNYKKILFLGIEHLKDCQPSLFCKQAIKYNIFKNSILDYNFLKLPFEKTHRMLNSLDIARYVDKEEGFDWLKNELLKVSTDYDAIIIPTICGIVNHSQYFEELKKQGLVIVEAISIPPGVGGYRLRNVLINEAKKLNINFVENCRVDRAIIDNNKCKSLIALHSNIFGKLETEYFADKFIIATGGIIGGGIVTTPYKVYEKIFNIEIETPTSIEERSDKNVFGNHIFTKFGIKVNNKLQAVDSNSNILFDNVFFAGNILSGYDFASEKSGYGVACTTGYVAGLSALSGDINGI